MLSTSANGLGIDFSALWKSAKEAGTELITKTLPEAAEKAVSAQAQKVAAPVIQQMAQEKATRVLSKGKVALMASAGVLLGALLAGGDWKRRALGGVVIGGLSTVAGIKIGLLSDST
jgi:hypothetical protein